jgi:hypothetical protein
MKKTTIYIVLFFLFFTPSLFGQAQLADSTKSKVFIEYNFLDLPFQIFAGKTVNSTIANHGTKHSNCK